MKKTIVLLCGILISIISFVSCTNEEEFISVNKKINFHAINENSHVSFQDIQTLVSAMHKKETRGESVENYVFVTDNNNGDTLFYVVNHPNGGWTMYASDKRVNPIVGENSTGHFNLTEARNMMGEWLEAMKEDMAVVRRSEDSELNISTDEINGNMGFWTAVCSPIDYLVSQRGESLAPKGMSLGWHYELFEVVTSTEVYDSVPHLTSTYWKQGYPYNLYCPNKSEPDYYDPRVPAGCVAIAAAQMLYYLHGKTGLPAQIPDSAVCDGTSTGMYQWITGRDIWTKMSGNNANYLYDAYDFNGNLVNAGVLAAPLVANVGKLVNMAYSDTVSTAYTSNLVSVFSNYGIQCQYSDFTWGQVRQSLVNQVPVIARAANSNNEGHVFLIDGYKRTRTKYEFCYFKVYDPIIEGADPITPIILPGIPITEQADYIRVEYSEPIISYINMNWGWGYSYLSNNTWLVPTGNWIATNGDNFLYNRKVIYGFTDMQ